MKPEDYLPLEKILFRGFITKPLKLGPVPILLKSITEYEHDYIEEVYFDITDPLKKFDYYLAYSIAMVNHSNILAIRSDDTTDTILDMIRSLPSEEYDRLTLALTEIRSQVEKSLGFLEAYNYTELSRTKWHSYKNFLLNQEVVTGWKGTEHIGLSSAQLLWTSYNRAEDHRMQYDTLNDLTRFLASVHNPKGMESINRTEVANREKEFERRKKIILGEKELQPDQRDIWGEALPEFMTPQELVKQMNRDLSGEKDMHLQLVELYEQEIQNMYKKQKVKLKKGPIAPPTNSNTEYRSSTKLVSEEDILELNKQAAELRAYQNSDHYEYLKRYTKQGK